MIDAGGIERAQHRPGAVDVVHAPAAVPAAVGELRAAQIVDAARHRRAARGRLAELRQHRQAARGDVLGRRIEQRAVIGERDVVEIIIFVVGVEGAPAAVLALHAHDPFAARARAPRRSPRRPDRFCSAVHRHGDDGGVVDIGIMRVGVLERPAAGPHVGPPRDPVAAHVEHLLRHQPVEAALDLGDARARRRLPAARGRPAPVSQTGETQGWQ